jgi:hypothetical protein
MKKILSIIVLGFALMAMLPAMSAAANRDFEVRCYVGNPSNNEYVGTIDIFDVSMAGVSCNNVFNACEGNCTGCYADPNDREVCVDALGRAYYE